MKYTSLLLFAPTLVSCMDFTASDEQQEQQKDSNQKKQSKIEIRTYRIGDKTVTCTGIFHNQTIDNSDNVTVATGNIRITNKNNVVVNQQNTTNSHQN